MLIKEGYIVVNQKNQTYLREYSNAYRKNIVSFTKDEGYMTVFDGRSWVNTTSNLRGALSYVKQILQDYIRQHKSVKAEDLKIYKVKLNLDFEEEIELTKKQLKKTNK